jgi:hypothetical protein
VILEEYTNGDGIHTNYNASIKLYLAKVGLTRLDTTYALVFKLRLGICVRILKTKLKQCNLCQVLK